MKQKNAEIPPILRLFSRSPWMAGALLAGIVSLTPMASAGTIGISNGRLIVGTEAGDGDQAISFSLGASGLVISGTNFDVVTPGCTGKGTVICALGTFNELDVLGGDGDDAIVLGAITVVPPFATVIVGGAGDDILIGSGGNDIIFGGLGDDVLIGGPGQDCLSGSPGDDVVIQSLVGACPTSPDPSIKPLPRPDAAGVPEPGGLMLLGTGLVALPMSRRSFRERMRGTKR